MTSQSDITEQIKNTADIVQVIGERVDLQKRGSSYLGLCPFHNEKTPSFSVNPDRQFYHCFGCGESGDVLSFVMKSQGLDFKDALRTLASRYGIHIPERRQSRQEKERRARLDALYGTAEAAADIFERYLYKGKGAAAAQKYLHKRGVSAELARKFRLGCAPHQGVEGWNFLRNNLAAHQVESAVEIGLLVKKERGGTYDRFRDRVLFPIFNVSGQICGFGGRILGDGKPKYLNSPESDIYNKSSLLLGLYQAKEAIRKLDRAIVVEGNFDMISLFAAGCENVVAPLGTALTREQLRLLKRCSSNVTLLFDGDAAGIKAARRSVPLFLAEQMAGRVALLPAGHDPDTFVRSEGLPALLKLLEDAEELPEFTLNQLTLEHGTTLDGKMRIVAGLKPLLEAIVDEGQRSIFISHFAGRLGLTAEELARQFENIAPLEQAPLSMPSPAPPSERQEAYREESFTAHPPDFSGSTIGFEEIPPPDIADFPYSEREADYDESYYNEYREEPLYPPPSCEGIQDMPELPLSKKQRQILDFMILNPEHFDKLMEAGLREVLSATAGENIVLAMQEMLSENREAEPEALLAKIAAGAERDFVAELLINPPIEGEDEEAESESEFPRNSTLAVMVQCLQEERAAASLPDLLKRIAAAEKAGDRELLKQLLAEQRQLSMRLQDIRESGCGIVE